MKIFKAVSAISVLLALAGCGGELDGTYIGGTGFVTVSVMELSGSRASIESIDTARRQTISTREYKAETDAEKLVLINADGQRFIYGLGADKESLECMSESCKGYGGLGAGGMPRTWQPFPEDK